MPKNYYIVTKITTKLDLQIQAALSLTQSGLNLKDISGVGNIGVCFVFTNKKKAKKFAEGSPILTCKEK